MIVLILLCSLNIEFNFTTGSFLNNNKSPELRIFYEIPRNKLTFIRFDEGFLAKFQISCILQARDKKEIGDIWIIKDTLKTYESTLKRALIKGELAISVVPGTYKLKVEVRDLNSQRIGEKTLQVVLKEISSSYSQSISSIKAIGPEGYQKDAKCTLFFEVYNFSGTPFDLFYKIGKVKNYMKFENTDFVNQVKLELPVDSIGFGSHIITISVGEVEVQDTLDIKEPFWTKDFEKRAKELHYIAKSWEIDSLLKVPVYKREQCWREFWARRDSSLGFGVEFEEVYFRRVDYANEHFSGLQEGWKTDRGRIYIKLGEPSEVEKHPFEISQKPYEVWYYYSKKLKFIFVDKFGFGDYVLEYPRYWEGEIQIE